MVAMYNFTVDSMIRGYDPESLTLLLKGTSELCKETIVLLCRLGVMMDGLHDTCVMNYQIMWFLK